MTRYFKPPNMSDELKRFFDRVRALEPRAGRFEVLPAFGWRDSWAVFCPYALRWDCHDVADDRSHPPLCGCPWHQRVGYWIADSGVELATVYSEWLMVYSWERRRYGIIWPRGIKEEAATAQPGDRDFWMRQRRVGAPVIDLSARSH